MLRKFSSHQRVMFLCYLSTERCYSHRAQPATAAALIQELMVPSPWFLVCSLGFAAQEGGGTCKKLCVNSPLVRRDGVCPPCLRDVRGRKVDAALVALLSSSTYKHSLR